MGSGERSTIDYVRSLVERTYDFFINHTWFIFLLWTLWLTLEYFCLGPFSYVRLHDVGDCFLPMRLGLIQEYFQYGFSYWFPYAACGIDRLSLAGLNFFQVDSLFFFTLPGWLAYGVVTFLQRFIAGYFTYRLCKDYLKLDQMPSIVAGLAYAISFSWLLYWGSYHTLLQLQFAGEMGFPLILWSLESIHKREGISKYLLVFLLGLFALFSSSLVGSMLFILPMILVWFVFVRQNYSLRFLSIYCIFVAVILIGNTPIILALLANAPLSQRAYWPDFGSYGSFEAMLTYGLGQSVSFIKTNVVYWGLGILGLLWIKFKDRRFLIVMLLLGFCAIGIHLVMPFWYLIIQNMGFASGFQFNRFCRLAPFFAIIAMGFGLHFFMRGWVATPEHASNSKKVRIQTILCVIVIIFLLFVSYQTKVEHAKEWVNGFENNRWGIHSYAVNYENHDLQHLADNTDSAPFRVATIVYDGLHPAFANAYGLESVDGYIVLYSKKYHDFWGKVIEPLTSKDVNRYNNFYNYGRTIYLYEPSDGSFDKIEKISFPEYYNLILLSLANTKYIISRKAVVNEDLTLLPSQVPQPKRSWANLSTEEKIKRGIINNFKERGLFIYKNENCFPRFFLADQVKVFPNSWQLLESMGQANLSSLRNTVFIEEQFTSEIKTDKLDFKQGEITIEQYSPDRIVLTVDLDGSGILVITNSYNPYWKCQVDGIERDIFPAYHTFSGIYLEGGQKTITLEYHPPYWSFY